VRFAGRTGELQGAQQLLRIDRIAQRLEQLEGTQATLEELQPMGIGGEDSQDDRPALADLAQQLEPRSVFQPLTGDDDLEGVLAQEIQAVSLVGDRIDDIPLP
jgi:hypothetical protein